MGFDAEKHSAWQGGCRSVNQTRRRVCPQPPLMSGGQPTLLDHGSKNRGAMPPDPAVLLAARPRTNTTMLGLSAY